MEGHRCTVCDKCFPCGRSLGGHMRSHVPPPGADHLAPALPGKAGGYCLRENPKKKRLYVLGRDCPSPATEKQCRECGKLFQSWRSLFGHMRCHSHRSFKDHQEDQEGSWSSHETGAGPIVPKRKRGSNQLIPTCSPETTACDLKLEEAAVALMMLCKGIRDSSSAAIFFREPSDKNSFDAEDLASDLSVRENGYLWNVVKKMESDVTDDWIDPSDESKEEEVILKRDSIEKTMNFDRAGLGKESRVIELTKFRSRYECSSCNKVFQTYQALGGHRASHKRMKGSCRPDAGDGSENSVEMNASTSAEEIGSPLKIKSHECFICGKFFQSGQALGGHKRSHLAMISSYGIAASSQQAPVILDLIDLNLPARADVDSTS